MKKALIFALLLFCSLCFAQTPRKLSNEEAPWRILSQAQLAFDSGNYGESLKLANKAKENRQDQITWESYILERALSPREVSRVGYHFSDVRAILRERDEHEAVTLLTEYEGRYTRDFFKNNVYLLADWIKESAVYPEADFLLGKIYQLEGEYSMASHFYEQARKNASHLDIHDQLYDILYAMASLNHQMGKMEEYEQILLLILDDDSFFKNKHLVRSIKRMLDADKEENVDRLFSLYRAKPNHSLQALYELGNLYASREDEENAYTCSILAVLEAFTHVFESLSQRDSFYEYVTLADFLQKTGRYPDILEWSDRQKFFESLFTLADRSASCGKLLFARELYLVLANNLPDEYWKAEALNRLVPPEEKQ